MWTPALYATMFLAVVGTTGVQGRRLWRHRFAGEGEERRASVAVWLLVISSCLIAATTLTSIDGSGPSFEHVNHGTLNLVPFQVIGGYLSEVEVGHGVAWRNLIGNVALFTPLGACLGLHPRISIRRGLAIMVLGAAGIEALQLTLGRSTEVDDLLLNVLGGVVAMTATASFIRGVHQIRAERTRSASS